MEVELHKGLLRASPTEDLTLLALCAFGYSGRHRVLPDDRSAWDAWARTFPADLADEVRLAWDDSAHRVAIGSASEQICVVPSGPSSYTGTPLRLTPTEALILLGRPLRVLLENGRNDRAFLLAFADGASRIALEKAENEGWLAFETAGGIGELKARLDEVGAAPDREIFRAMHLCDSDALEPSVPSTTATAIANALAGLCTRLQQPAGHFGTVLTRRAAENYAPPEVVLDWAKKPNPQRAARDIRASNTPHGRATVAG